MERWTDVSRSFGNGRLKEVKGLHLANGFEFYITYMVVNILKYIVYMIVMNFYSDVFQYTSANINS